MKHRKHRKVHHRRRHRIGAMSLNPANPVLKLAAVGLGYFLAADPINSAIDKILPDSMKPDAGTGTAPGEMVKYVPGAVEVGLGAMFLLSKRRPSLIKTLASGVVAGAGLKRLLKASGVITGYQATPVIGRARHHRMAGYQSVPVVGLTTPPQLSGTPAQLEGYRVNGPRLSGYVPHGSGVGVMGGVGNYDSTKGSGINYGGSSGYMG